MAEKFKFKIENDVHEWDTQFISGRDVRGVGAGIPDSMDLFVKIQGAPGVLVELDKEIDLKTPGIEKFYSQEASSEAGGK